MNARELTDAARMMLYIFLRISFKKQSLRSLVENVCKMCVGSTTMPTSKSVTAKDNKLIDDLVRRRLFFITIMNIARFPIVAANAIMICMAPNVSRRLFATSMLKIQDMLPALNVPNSRQSKF